MPRLDRKETPAKLPRPEVLLMDKEVIISLSPVIYVENQLGLKGPHSARYRSCDDRNSLPEMKGSLRFQRTVIRRL